MKLSTLRVRSKALAISNNMAEDIRNGKNYIIKPLLSKFPLNNGDYLYLKELQTDGTFTTKNTAKTFIQIKSNKIVNVRELTKEDIRKLEIDNNEDFKTYYTKIIEDMIGNTVKNDVSIRKLIKEFSYEANPTIELLEVEIVNATNTEE